MEQLLSSLAATADISAPVLDAIGTPEERPAAFSGAVQQLCMQVPPCYDAAIPHGSLQCICIPSSLWNLMQRIL